MRLNNSTVGCISLDITFPNCRMNHIEVLHNKRKRRMFRALDLMALPIVSTSSITSLNSDGSVLDASTCRLTTGFIAFTWARNEEQLNGRSSVNSQRQGTQNVAKSIVSADPSRTQRKTTHVPLGLGVRVPQFGNSGAT